jgi:excisionase family DNA binding protein
VIHSKETLPVLDDLPPFLTVKQAAVALQLGRSKTYQLTVEWDRSHGQTGLPFIWLGCQKRIPREALARFIEEALHQ